MHSDNQRKPPVRERSGRVILLLVTVCLVLVAGHGFAYWLPWANEGDKVKKTLNEIWQALLKEDKPAARLYLAGDGVDFFIQQELDLIKRFGIKSFDFKIGEVTVAKAGATIAYVKFDKIALLENGNEMKTPALGVFRKAGGMWRYITGLGLPPKKKDEPVDPLKAIKIMSGAARGGAPARNGAAGPATR